jgi:localization factor PodJL
MRQNVPLRKSGAAEAETERASRSIDEWLEAAIADQARRATGRDGGTSGREERHEPAPAPAADVSSAQTRGSLAPTPKSSTAIGSMTTWIEQAQEELAEVGKTPPAVPGASLSSNQSYDALSAVERLDTDFGLDRTRTNSQALQEEAFRSLENRIREIAGRIEPPKNTARASKGPSRPLEEAVAEIRARQSALEEPLVPAPAAPRAAPVTPPSAPAPAAEPVGDARPEVRAETNSPADAPAAAQALPPGLEALKRDIDRVHGSMAALATRSDIGALERSIGALASEIAEARARGRSLVPVEAEVEALQAEVQRLAAHDRSPSEGVSKLARDIDIVSHKLDIVAASGIDPAAIESLGREVAEVKRMLGAMSAPADIGALNTQLNELRLELARIGSRQVDVQDFTSLRLAFEEMRDSLSAGSAFAAAAPSPAVLQKATRDELQPIASMLVMLIEKIERLERHSGDPDIAEQIERQIAGLSATIGSTAARDPGLSDLSEAMSDLMAEVASWRDGTVEIAEQAARHAVAQTIEAMRGEFPQSDFGDGRAAMAAPSEAPLVANRVQEDEGQQPAAEPDVTRSAVQPTPSAEAERPEPAREMSDAALRRLNEALLLGPTLTEADRPLPRAPENEVLLEPGAGRPQAAPHVVPDVDSPADGRDIKASFIAAARRAAQAAATDAEKNRARATDRASATPAGKGQGSPKLRGVLDRLRRPLLVSAAALAVAVGAYRLTVELTATDPAQLLAGRVAPESSSAGVPVITAPSESKIAVLSSAAEPPEPNTTATLAPPRDSQGAASPSGAPGSAGTTAGGAAAEPRPTPAQPGAGSNPAEATSQKQASQLPEPVAPKPPAAPDNAAPSAALKQAALNGDPAALYELAVRTMEGRGVPRDPRGAVAMFEKAGEKNLAPAQYRAGNAYEKGLGVTRDVEAARRWYQRAAENGNTRAMHNLAVLMAEGASGKPDYATAMTWFVKAAEHGVRDSQFNLAVLYARGLGAQQDLVRSYTWFAIAAGQGDEEAGRKRDEVAARLQPADLARARSNVERWRVTPPSPAANDAPPPPARMSSHHSGRKQGRA